MNKAIINRLEGSLVKLSHKLIRIRMKALQFVHTAILTIWRIPLEPKQNKR